MLRLDISSRAVKSYICWKSCRRDEATIAVLDGAVVTEEIKLLITALYDRRRPERDGSDEELLRRKVHTAELTTGKCSLSPERVPLRTDRN